MSNRTPSAYSIPPARKVSPLRQRMIDDMTVRNLAPNTMLCYLKQVSYLARYFGRSPAQLGPEEIREYELYLAQDRKVSVSSRLVAITALRFLYGVTEARSLHRNASNPPQGALSAGDPQPGRSPTVSPSGSVLFSPRHLQHHVRRGCVSARPYISGLATSTASA